MPRRPKEELLRAAICPSCSGKKDTRSVLCRNCRGMTPEERQRLEVCPTCKGKKDHRAQQCCSCRMKTNHPQQGTAKDWHVNRRGYLYRFRDGERQLQHRVIMEEFLGRKLSPDEHVHHKNHNKLDNRIENLEVLSKREHHRLHADPETMKKRSRLAVKKLKERRSCAVP